MTISTTRFVALFSLALPSLVAAGTAHAQPVSDADRATARQLYFQGVELQTAQKYGEALDRFERAERVVNAPTNLLHIAECQAAMNHLVEAAEKYRELLRFPLGADSPAAFKQAQEQGKGELAQVEPRIPELTINVQPANVPTLSVTIDDQPVNSALVGVSRPINPGVHKIAASAPGFTKAELTVDVKEKGKAQSVTLNLQSTGGVIYGPAGGGGGGGGAPGTTSSGTVSGGAVVISGPAPGAGSGAPAGAGAGAGGGGAPGASGTDVNGQPMNAASPEQPAPYERTSRNDTRSRTSLMLGVRGGVTGVVGSYATIGATTNTGIAGFSSASASQGESFSDVSSGGGGIGVDVAFRFARMAYVGVVGEFDSFGSKQPNGGTITYKTTGGLAAVKVGLITNPDGVAFMGDLGVGYRWFSIANDQDATTIDPKGGEGEVGVGMHFKAGKLVRLAPMFEMDVGNAKPDNLPSSATAGSTTTTVSGGTYVVLSLYLRGYFDIDLDKRTKKATSDNGVQGITTW